MNDLTPAILAVDNGLAHVFDHVDNDGPMWSGEGRRWARAVIKFQQPFVAPPAIQLSIALIDADSSRNLRLDLHAEDVTPTGFLAVAHTWLDTRIGRLQVNWTAIGARTPADEPAWNI